MFKSNHVDRKPARSGNTVRQDRRAFYANAINIFIFFFNLISSLSIWPLHSKVTCKIRMKIHSKGENCRWFVKSLSKQCYCHLYGNHWRQHHNQRGRGFSNRLRWNYYSLWYKLSEAFGQQEVFCGSSHFHSDILSVNWSIKKLNDIIILTQEWPFL